MLALLGALSLLGAGAAAGKAEMPVFCVAVSGDTSIEETDLVAALRARVARPKVRVQRCAELKNRRPTWRLAVERVAPDRVDLTMTGKDLWARRFVTTSSLNREEILQQIALTAAEVVRPSIDTALAKMGEAPPPEDDPVQQLEAQLVCPPPEVCPECPETSCPPQAEVAPRLQFLLSGGPMLGLPSMDFAGFAELRAGVHAGPLQLGLHFGGRTILPQQLGLSEVGGWELELGLDALWRWKIARAGLRAQSRTSLVSLNEPGAATTTQVFWRGGLGGLFELVIWHDEMWEIGTSTQIWLWPQPNRFLVRGDPVYTQPYAELAIGIHVGFSPF